MDNSLSLLLQLYKTKSQLKTLPILLSLIGASIITPAFARQTTAIPQPSPQTIESILEQTAPTAPKPVHKPTSRAKTSDSAPVITTPSPIPVPKLAPDGDDSPAPLPSFPEVVPPARDAPYETPTTVQQTQAIVQDEQTAGTRSFPRFGDRKPHIWTSRRKPWDYAIHGTDVSWHNKSLNWSKMKRNGISFVFIKATEGGDFLDPTFAQNWKASKKAGIVRGAYHFYYFCRSAKDQLRWYIRNVPKDKNALPPVLDMEWNHASKTCRYQPSPAIVQREMRTFLKGVEKHYGKRPIIYTSVDFFDDNNLGKAFKNYPFWLRSVAAHPEESYDNHPWLFWQYTGTGRVPGMEGDADINIFIGNPSQWEDWKQRIR